MYRPILRLLPGVAISVAFTVWFLARARWREVGEALVGVDLRFVALSAAVLFSEFLIRAVRWQVLLRPLAPGARLSRLFVATVIGMGLNVVLPFRAGDMARPWLGQRETGVGLLPLATIAVIERVFDLVGLLFVFLLMLVLLPEGADQGVIGPIRSYGAVFGAGAIFGLGAFVVLAAREGDGRRLVERLAGLLPAPARARVLGLYDGLAHGLHSVRSPRALAEAMGWSIALWVNGSLSMYLLFSAFDLDLPFAAACFTTVGLALSVALPQAPGFFGVFHAAVESTLRLWGLDPAPAQAYAITLWATSFVPVASVAGVLWLREGLDWKTLGAARLLGAGAQESVTRSDAP